MMNLHFSHLFYSDFYPKNPQYQALDLQQFFNKQKELPAFFHALDEELKLHEIWLKCFTHKSFTYESKAKLEHNERLEFLGDSVIQLVITQELISKFPESSEGELSKMRSFLVNAKQLALLSLVFEFPKMILVGKGEYKKSNLSENILADTFESFIGAFYSLYGLEKTRDLILKMMQKTQEKLGIDFFDLNNLKDFDVRSKLQEAFLHEFGFLPEFKVSSVGAGEDLKFQAELMIKGQSFWQTQATSKKLAITKLSELCLINENWNKIKESLC